MNYNQFKNISCYEEFEIQAALTGISKIDILREIGNQIDKYYFFISNDGIFNWFDLNGNHVKDPSILKEIQNKHIHYNIHYTITKCIIPNGVTRIGTHAFSSCYSLKEIVIPDSVKSIGDYAFSYCESLKEIVIPDSVKSIGTSVFSGCKSLTTITIPDSITHIGVWAFSNCKSLKEVIFKGRTLEQVKRMNAYPWNIDDESIIKCEL